MQSKLIKDGEDYAYAATSHRTPRKVRVVSRGKYSSVPAYLRAAYEPAKLIGNHREDRNGKPMLVVEGAIHNGSNEGPHVVAPRTIISTWADYEKANAASLQAKRERTAAIDAHNKLVGYQEHELTTALKKHGLPDIRPQVKRAKYGHSLDEIVFELTAEQMAHVIRTLTGEPLALTEVPD